MEEKKSKDGLIKFLRVIVYVLSISGTTIGASLIKTGELSASYADGTDVAKIINGEIIFFTSLIILYFNIMWGILRWVLRGYHEQWTPGRIVGKLIGGGIWRTLAIVPLVFIVLYFITPKISNTISNNVLNVDDSFVSLSANYDRLEYLNENFEKLDVETVKSELNELLFNNVDFGADASSNIAHVSNSLFVQNASAYSSTVTILNKAKLSKSSHFVVFYTDAGDDKISDERANKLAEALETIITGYKNNLELDYEYKKFNNHTDKLKKMQEVLKNSGIDENTLEYAMPVYVVNPYKNGSNTLATYAGRKFRELSTAVLTKLWSILGEETFKLYDSTPSYPFINVIPAKINSEDMTIVMAHELGHHYVSNYNYNNYGEHGSSDKFISETTANWLAINAMPNQPTGTLINRYHNIYIRKSIKYKISEAHPDFLGYPPVAFLENYYEIVPNAKKIIMDATYNGDALNYLYEKAGAENYKKVMISLAEKNVMAGGYDGKLANNLRPNGERLNCLELCSESYSMNPSSTSYVYFASSEYENAKISFKGSNGVFGSILGFKDGKYEVIKSGKSQTDFVIPERDSNEYSVFVIAVANTNLSEGGIYKIDVVTEELEDLMEEPETATEEFEFSGLFSELGSGCYEINTDRVLDYFINFLDLGSGHITRFEKNKPGDYSDAKTAIAEAKNEFEAARKDFSRYQISICAKTIWRRGRSFDDIKKRLQSSLKYNMNIIDKSVEDFRLSLFVSFDPLARASKIYTLISQEEGMGFVTLVIRER